MDQELLEAARAAGAVLVEAELGLELAKADYHHAIRRLHLAGASLREIADALGLSHQRVHQIVDNAGGGRRWRVRRADPQACSFCHRDRIDVAHLIAGPGVWICDGCVAEARQLVSKGGVPMGPKFGQRCSFCGRGEHKVGPLAESEGNRICGNCLKLCEEIMRDERPA